MLYPVHLTIRRALHYVLASILSHFYRLVQRFLLVVSCQISLASVIVKASHLWFGTVELGYCKLRVYLLNVQVVIFRRKTREKYALLLTQFSFVLIITLHFLLLFPFLCKENYRIYNILYLYSLKS